MTAPAGATHARRQSNDFGLFGRADQASSELGETLLS